MDRTLILYAQCRPYLIIPFWLFLMDMVVMVLQSEKFCLFSVFCMLILFLNNSAVRFAAAKMISVMEDSYEWCMYKDSTDKDPELIGTAIRAAFIQLDEDLKHHQNEEASGVTKGNNNGVEPTIQLAFDELYVQEMCHLQCLGRREVINRKTPAVAQP